MGLAIQTGDPRYLGWYDDTTPVRRRDGTAVLDSFGRPVRGKGEIGDIPVLNAELEGDSALESSGGRLDGFSSQTEWSNRDGQAELAPGELPPGSPWAHRLPRATTGARPRSHAVSQERCGNRP